MRATAYPTLALNADFSVMGVWTWREAIAAVFNDRVSVVAEYARLARSPSTSMRIPSVVALREYHSHHRPAAFTRRNLRLAYAIPTPSGPAWRCALSGALITDPEDITMEHIVPRARGGRNAWDNVVIAKSEPNNRKGDRTLAEAGMTLHVRVLAPTERDIALADVLTGYRDPPTDWIDYVGGRSESYWTVPIEP